jgi:hypothetical protein
MDSYLREFFIYRISSRYLIFNDLRIHYPTIDTLYEAQDLYRRTYEQSVDEGILTNDEMLREMVERNLWSEYEDDQLTNVLPKHLEHWKVELFKNFDNEAEMIKIQAHLQVAKKALEDLFRKRHAFDHMTCHGVATFAKYYYSIENSVTKDGQSYQWDKVKVFNALDYINKNTIEEETIREIARSEPWLTTWHASTKAATLFSGSATELTEDQKRLISWSRVYDNVKEHENCPSEEITNCDDAFDGWLIVQKRESDLKKNEKSYSSVFSKYKENTEVYMPVDKNWHSKPKSEEEKRKEASKIWNLNSEINRNIIKNRIKTVQERGEVVDMDFADVKLAASMARNRAAIAARKNG